MQGIIKQFNTEQGYGFVTPDEGGDKDIFIHISSINRDKGDPKPERGDVVEFDIEKTEKGLNAINVIMDK